MALSDVVLVGGRRPLRISHGPCMTPLVHHTDRVFVAQPDDAHWPRDVSIKLPYCVACKRAFGFDELVFTEIPVLEEHDPTDVHYCFCSARKDEPCRRTHNMPPCPRNYVADVTIGDQPEFVTDHEFVGNPDYSFCFHATTPNPRPDGTVLPFYCGRPKVAHRRSLEVPDADTKR